MFERVESRLRKRQGYLRTYYAPQHNVDYENLLSKGERDEALVRQKVITQQELEEEFDILE